MTIVLTDANILIDLIKLDLLQYFFRLPFEFVTTELVLDELYDEQRQSCQAHIQSNRFRILEIEVSQSIEIAQLSAQQRSLSIQDCSAYYFAEKIAAILLTSDNQLRRFARRGEVDVHGHLWIFDKLVETSEISPDQACAKLDELTEVVNVRLGLPEDECRKRKTLWKSSI